MRLLPLALLLCALVATAQPLPAPSRTVYKCEEGGKVHYSDSPCLGARKLEVEPTRGMNKSSGRVMVGRDVSQERFREALNEGTRPLTGMNVKQTDQFGRRMKLPADVQQQCRSLDARLPMAEAAERAATGKEQELKNAQKRLFDLRTAYRKLGCD